MEERKMKGLNYLILAGLALVAAASCNKQLDPAEEPEVKAGIPMTLTASIGGPDTKLSFTEEGNVLKGTWSANEQISVITLNDYGSVKTIDTFTTGSESEGSRTAEFTGVLSADANLDKIQVLYPALVEEYYDGVPLYYGSAKVYTDHRLLGRVKIGSDLLAVYPQIFTQSANGDKSHLGPATILEGVATVSDGVLSVSLKPLTSVLKLNCTLSGYMASGSVEYITVSAIRSNDNKYCFTNELFSYFGGDGMPINNNSFYSQYYTARIYMGHWNGNAHTHLYINGDRQLTVYIPFVPGKGAVWGPSGGAKLSVKFEGRDIGSTRTITLNNDTYLEPGKMYRLNVDFTN